MRGCCSYLRLFDSMTRLLAVALTSALLQACGSHPPAERSDPAGQRRFTDAAHCLSATEIKERVQVQTGASTTVLEIALSYDMAAFGACMERAGHPPPKADPAAYLAVARKCVQEADRSGNAEATYAECVRQSGISVEALPAGEPE